VLLDTSDVVVDVVVCASAVDAIRIVRTTGRGNRRIVAAPPSWWFDLCRGQGVGQNAFAPGAAIIARSAHDTLILGGGRFVHPPKGKAIHL
jgi:hypothetical protein